MAGEFPSYIDDIRRAERMKQKGHYITFDVGHSGGAIGAGSVDIVR